MPGHLFASYFLTEGIRDTPEWKAAAARPEAFAAFRDGVRRRYDALSGSADPNEAVTEQELIRPVLELLGWDDYLPQQGAARNEDIPDLLLFPDAGSKERASARIRPEERFRDAIVVEESKRFGLPLDARDEDGRGRSRTPHGQILRYLSTADVESDSRIRWGILTNGGVWRLYDHRARPRASGYFETELAEALQSGNEDGLRLFYLLMRRSSFTPQRGAVTSFLETALLEGRRHEQQVAEDISGTVFERVFPALVRALADAADDDLPAVREAALIFLYRLLFVLYAEDRGLLPVNDTRYEDYGLRKPVREHVARRMDAGAVFSDTASSYYDHLMTLCGLIDRGDASIGLPPYNGGLFSADAAPLLGKVRLSDASVAPIVYDLSHAETAGGRRFVNYRDMSVQQLGSIYERLLEREPVRDDDGKIVVRPNSYARKDSGSFYTPQELVDLIVDRTLKPLAEERLAAFEQKAAALKGDRRPKPEREAELRALDPAEAVLDLKVLDPAMGSGHFLVTAVDFLSDYVAELVEYAPVVPEWLDGEYASPLLDRVAAIQARHPRPRPAVRLGDRRGAAHRPGHPAPDGAEAVHLRRRQEPAHRRAGQGVAVASQLHRRRAAVVSRPPPAPRRLARRHAGAGGEGRAEAPGRAVRTVGHRGRRGRHRKHAAHRGDVRRRRRGGAGVRLPIPARRGNDSRPARPARLHVRPALADRRHEGQGAKVLPVPDRRRARPPSGRHLQPAGQGPRRLRRRRRRPGPGVRVPVEECPVGRGPGGLSALGGGVPGRLAGLAGRPSGRRLRRRDRQPAVGPDQAPGGGVVRDPRP